MAGVFLLGALVTESGLCGSLPIACLLSLVITIITQDVTKADPREVKR